jgi:Raf kinase inhibitor-like YbhB/YbcL family protein
MTAVAAASALAGFVLSSTAVPNGGTIPTRYTCDGKGVSPPLQWTAPPAGTRKLTLLVADPDAPSGLFIHWQVTALPPHAGSVREGHVFRFAAGNSSGKRGWTPPCPPRGQTHQYLFVMKALNASGQAIAEADLIAHYRRR